MKEDDAVKREGELESFSPRMIEPSHHDLGALDVSMNGAVDSSDGQGQFPAVLLPAVPEKCPHVWAIINNCMAISGVLLILELACANEDTLEQPFARAFYLVFEFSACFFWSLESGLSASYQHWQLKTAIKWYTKLELAVAVYFMLSTFWMLWQWNLSVYDKGQIWEVALDTSFYVAEIAARIYQGTSSSPEENEAAISLQDHEGGSKTAVPSQEGEGAYQIMAKDGSGVLI